MSARIPSLLSACLLVCVMSAAGAARAVPAADHVRVECSVLRLNVNDFSIRRQIKVHVTVSAQSEAELSGVELALMSISNPEGEAVTLGARNWKIIPRRFKAAHAKLLFKAIEDSSAPFPQAPTNVPTGFFTSAGPYDVALTVRGEQYSGRVSFGDELSLTVAQNGRVISNFSLANELGFSIETQPPSFGPVYYKRQDMTNFVFQLASIDQALESQDYHPVVESPRYLFQIRVGDPEGGPTRLIDPARYIQGYTPHLIRSDSTATPLAFAASEFDSGEVVVIDFSRTETLPPDTVFQAAREGFSSQTAVQDRIVYAMYVEDAPTPAELGQLPGVLADDSSGEGLVD